VAATLVMARRMELLAHRSLDAGRPDPRSLGREVAGSGTTSTFWRVSFSMSRR
jgi:hypothetical protein